ncbi:hypothetical protein GOBAR_AA25669 [Gossypium barbadense]|uniref:Uncharacterized protein n=1 Tax=Gossypium barbadense TaxID=3634 RepID=A0A2P5WV94_GOSBA|nr:hypothetical protein GOBAR_AA25669 [Gossypium barbadense]
MFQILLLFSLFMPILPVLAKVFDQALEGGGVKNINFQDLASDLAAIGVLEGIALVGNPDIAIVDEAYPYIAQRLLTDEFPRLRNALRNTIYGKSGVFYAERFIDVMQAFENFIIATKSGGGENLNGDMAELGLLQRQVDISFPRFLPTALGFLVSEKGKFFREFLLDEIVKGIDALILGVRNATPVFSLVPTVGPFKLAGLLPSINEEDRVILNNVKKILEFLTAGTGSLISTSSSQGINVAQVIQELLPVLPSISARVLLELIFVGIFVGIQELLFIFVGIFNVTTLFNCVYACIADIDII